MAAHTIFSPNIWWTLGFSWGMPPNKRIPSSNNTVPLSPLFIPGSTRCRFNPHPASLCANPGVEPYPPQSLPCFNRCCIQSNHPLQALLRPLAEPAISFSTKTLLGVLHSSCHLQLYWDSKRWYWHTQHKHSSHKNNNKTNTNSPFPLEGSLPKAVKVTVLVRAAVIKPTATAICFYNEPLLP